MGWIRVKSSIGGAGRARWPESCQFSAASSVFGSCLAQASRWAYWNYPRTARGPVGQLEGPSHGSGGPCGCSLLLLLS